MARCHARCRNYVSKLFQPQNIVPKNAEVKDNLTSRSQRLMLDVGVMRHAGAGTFFLLPLGERSLSKLIHIVDKEMQNIGAQKLIFPTLTSADLWKQTGRWATAADELFILKDRHEKELILSPTHEEAVTALLASISQVSYRTLPLKLYQITSKFRDEMKPRFGLMRAREFIMKDLYTFDESLEKAKESYNAVVAAYKKVFDKINVRYMMVSGTTGTIGGVLSHEFHFPAAVGEDRLLVCKVCGHSTNVEVLLQEGRKHIESSMSASYSSSESDVTYGQDHIPEECPECNSNATELVQGIEVGHTFLLGTKYSKPLQAKFLQSDGKPAFFEMGCYGLGMSRILAAAIEALPHPTDIRWPFVLAPFKVCIIPPKMGSKESSASCISEYLYEMLDSEPSLHGDVIIDDRTKLTIGRRLLDANRTGYPYAVIVGHGATESEPLIEVLNVNSGEKNLFSLPATVQFLTEQSAKYNE